MISVSWKMASVIAGRSRCFQPSTVRNPVRPRPEGHDFAAAEARQPIQRDGEDKDQQDADQEGRQRNAEQRERHHHLRQKNSRFAAPQ